MNIKLIITYDGTEYSGFQVQDNAPTIQGEIERALGVIYKQPVRITGAGRTDAGVHARGQVANYSPPFEVPVERLPQAINSLLSGDIAVTGAEEVGAEFHARYSARGKIYIYTIDRAPYPRVMQRRFSFHYPEPLDLDLMVAAARILEGTHDFKAFQASGSPVKDTVRTLWKVDMHHNIEDQMLKLIFHGNGFLYRMVRLLTGSLIRVGQGRLNKEEILLALAGKMPEAAGPTAPPQGLCLEQVIY